MCPYSTDQIAEPGPECRVEAHIPQPLAFTLSVAFRDHGAEIQ